MSDDDWLAELLRQPAPCATETAPQPPPNNPRMPVFPQGPRGAVRREFDWLREAARGPQYLN